MKPPLHFDIELARQNMLNAMARAKEKSFTANIPAKQIEPMHRLAVSSVEMRLEFLRLLNEGYDDMISAAGWASILGQIVAELVINAPSAEIEYSIKTNFELGVAGRMQERGELSTISAIIGGNA